MIINHHGMIFLNIRLAIFQKLFQKSTFAEIFVHYTIKIVSQIF